MQNYAHLECILNLVLLDRAITSLGGTYYICIVDLKLDFQ
jgi:hypothetical protein